MGRLRWLNQESPGFSRGECQKESLAEPFVWEPKDWTPQEWATICKLCNLPVEHTQRIILHADQMESFVNIKEEPAETDRDFIVIEWCPHCKHEVKMRWNTDVMGYKAFCPVCGKQLMLCDKCIKDGKCARRCDFNFKTNLCYRNPVKETPLEITPALRVETPLGAIVVRMAGDPSCPGVWIDLRRPDVGQDMPLALVGFYQDKSDQSEGQASIITRVWGDGQKEEYTYRIVHRGIEEYFNIY